MRVAIVGSRTYENKRKIKDTIFKLKTRFGSDLEIVSGGCPHGADKYAKKFAMELDVDYVEFPPYHAQWNPYCVKEKYLYGKPYKSQYFFMRNSDIAKYADVVLAFIDTESEANGTRATLKFAEKYGKPWMIFD